MQLAGCPFQEITTGDFEFSVSDGGIPHPICLVAHELGSGRVHRLWEDDLRKRSAPPYPCGPDTLFVAYYSSAELGCHLALDWPLPTNVLDLYVEFRNLTNGRRPSNGDGLLGALTYFGFPAMDVEEKESMRRLALRGGPWTAQERNALLTYCESDVVALAQLLPRMEPYLDVPRAVHRGRFMRAAARIEHIGVPLDTETLGRLQRDRDAIQAHLIGAVDEQYGIFEGKSFRSDRFAAWLARNAIPWPYSAGGRLALDDETFREMSRRYPLVKPLRELRATLAQLRLLELPVGPDGRNRVLLSAFRSRTGRNQPSNSRFIFGTPSWLRRLIRPPEGFGVAYLDWAQQEFGIAAALSGDTTMLSAYNSGDPYLAFAQQAGAAPHHATKESHGVIREQFKACALGVLYGMGVSSLARQINQPEAWARQLLALHQATYWTFWQWSDRLVDYAMIHSRVHTVFGWTLHVIANANVRTIRNFPMQATGAEMLRLACCLATERGIRVCAPVHDAILIEAPLDELDAAVATARRAMDEASRVVLDGFTLRTECTAARFPKRFDEPRGRAMWDRVMGIIQRLDAEQPARGGPPDRPSRGLEPGPPVDTRSISSLSTKEGCHERS